MNFDLASVLLGFTDVLIILIFIYVCSKSKKTQLHYVFMSNLALLFIWCTGVLLQVNIYKWNSELGMYMDYIAYTGICFVPVTLLLTGIIFAKNNIKLKIRYILMFAVPVISIVILWTNRFHSLFYKNYSTISSEVIFGKYFQIHALYSYACVLGGLFYLLFYAIKNSGLFSKQAVLICIGFFVPLIVNILFTYNIVNLSNAATPITFSFLVICCLFATLKYNLLDLVPIALRSVVDNISDSFVVLNKELVIVDYNKRLIDTLGKFYRIDRNRNFMEVVNSSELHDPERDKYVKYIEQVFTSGKVVSFEKHMALDNFDKYYIIEITPVVSNYKCIGVTILLKDITELKKSMEVIQQSQSILRKERHDFLNHLNTLTAMCLLKKTDTLHDIEHYAKKLINNIAPYSRFYDTGNHYIDGLLSVKDNAGTQKNIDLDVNLDLQLSALDVDDVDLTSIIGNIIDNAFDAITMSDNIEAANKKIVSLYTYCEGNKGYISISNNGPRIPDDIIEKIFENKFSTKPGNEGERGYGLFITKELVLKNLGRITVESTDESTEFLLEFDVKESSEIVTLIKKVD